MNDWAEVALGDHVDMLVGHPFKSGGFLDSPVDAVRLLRGDNVGQGALRWQGAKHWPVQAAEIAGKYLLMEDDVILAMDRPWIEAGLKCAYVRKSDLPCLLVQRVTRMRGTSTLDTGFLRHLIGSPAFTGHVLSIITGVNVPHISSKDIARFRFKLPPIETQRRIASILGAYDDLIEVNRRRVAILEEMARGLFEEWFLRFRFPGHESVPMVKTADGLLPEGWSAATLGDFLTLQRGFDLPATQRTAGNFPVISASGVHGSHSEGKIKAPGVVTGRSGTIGQVHLIMEDFWPLNTTLYVKEIKKAGPAFAMLLLQHFDLSKHSSGSAVPTLNRNHVHGVRVVAAPDALLSRFEEIAMSCFKTGDVITRQSALLATSRDLLLPRLISGQLSVEAAERELEAAE